MNRRRNLPTLVLSACLPLFAGVLLGATGDTNGKTVHCAPSVLRALSTDGPTSSDPLSGIDEKVRNWIRWNAPSASRGIGESLDIHRDAKPRITGFINSPSRRITIGGKEVELIAPLGSGGNGVVFLTRSASGDGRLYAVKFLYNKWGYYDHKEHHSNEHRDDLPKLIAADEGQFAILLEYKEGIPVYFIENHGKELGFTQQRIDEIVRRYKALSFNDAGSSNIVYSPSEDEFFLIDPY